MDFCVLSRWHQGKKRPVRKFYVVDSTTFQLARNEFVRFEAFRDFARNLGGVDFHLCSKGHNVVYHWNVREKGTNVNLYKFWPHTDMAGRIWTIELCKIDIIESFPPPRSPILDKDIVCQFYLPFAKDGIEADKQGRAVTKTYVSPECLKMFSSMVQHQSHNFDDQVINGLAAYCSAIERFEEKRLRRALSVTDLKAIVSDLPGYKQMIMTSKFGDQAEILGEERLQGLVWVAPWAWCMQKGTHREVDCSFKAATPYVFYIPMAVIGNVGVACGLVIYPVEKWKTFELWDRAFENVFGYKISVPVLSDMGSGIQKFCRKRELTQFYCHRHILERLGSKTIIAKLFRHLLTMLTIDDINRYLPQFLVDVIFFASAGQVTQNGLEQIERLVGVHFERGANNTLTGRYTVINEHARVCWQICSRGGVSRCTNHVEPFHHHLNANQRPNTSFSTKVLSITRMVTANAREFNRKLENMVAAKQRELASEVKGTTRQEGQDPESHVICLCPENARNQLMYQTVDGFCRHTALRKRVEHDKSLELEIPEEFDKTPVDIVQAEKIIHVGETDEQSKPPAFVEEDTVLTQSERIPDIIRSLSLLLELDQATTAAYLMRFCEQFELRSDLIKVLPPFEVSKLKYNILRWMETGPTP